ncbi:MAG: glycosyltransferase family 4 protein [Candidatus Poseidoniaceae archaeon]
MRILWASVRDLGADLCATTQRALVKGLAEHGHAVAFVGPGETPVSIEGVDHRPIEVRARSGRRSRAIAHAIAARWEDFPSPDVVLVEWPLLRHLLRAGVLAGIPWMLVDRSPPADAGFLARVHWFVWRRAWRLAAKAGRKHAGPVGTVVSEAHARRVRSFTKLDAERVVVLQAGVDLRRFLPGPERRSTERTLHLVYHGRLDRNRGVLVLPMLHQKAKNAGLDVTLTLIGEGDALGALKRMAKGSDDVHVLGRLPQDEVAHRLGTSHLGLLPMPEHRAWSLASPLKRSEYLASGLMVAGIDHDGHRLSGETPFMHLFAKEEFHDGIVDLLKRMERDATVYVEGKRAARRYADDHLGWAHSVEALHTAIEGSVGETVPKEKVVPGFGETPSPEPPTSAPVVEEAPEPEPQEPEPVEVQPPVPEPTPEPEPIEEPTGPRRKM